MLRTEIERRATERERARQARDAEIEIAREFERTDWAKHGRPEQHMPQGDWLTWLYLAGRGCGKTRSGAEAVRESVCGSTPLSGGRYGRIAIIAETSADARDVLVEGPSGLLAVHPSSFRPVFQPSKRRLTWPNGAIATLYNAVEPDQLRGPQHDLAWCFIAGTKIATPKGFVSIETMQAGNFVLTRSGPRRVVANSARAAQPVGRVTFDNGAELIGTADHPVLTSHGWTSLSGLREGELVCAINASVTAASGGIATAMDITSFAEQGRSGALTEIGCIAPSGATPMGKFRPGLTSTMWTETPATTLSTIFSSCRKAIIEVFTSLWTLRRQPTLALCAKLDPAKIAELRSLGISAEQPFVCHANGFAPTPSERRQDSANSAEASFAASGASFAASVASTWAPAGNETVYNLQVEGSPEYFANGILVHNCDELAKWAYADETWDQLQFGLRLGARPRQIVTTTPRPIAIIRRLLAAADTVVTRGHTMDNAANLAPSFLKKIMERYEGTRLGRQELAAEVIDDVPGALWTRDMIDAARKPVTLPDMARIVVAIDPSGARGADDENADSIGIVVAGRGVDGRGYLLADRTCKLSPAGWGAQAARAYHEFNADRVIAERNFGGAMVEAVIRAADPRVPFKEVVASRGKAVRAEPVAALYEQGRITHAGNFVALEDQMVSMTAEGFLGEGSPDRVDAMVWAFSELLIEPQQRATRAVSIPFMGR